MITEWQYRMPEDRNSEDGWMDNTEAGATYLQTDCGAEIRSRTVTEWVTKTLKVETYDGATIDAQVTITEPTE